MSGKRCTVRRVAASAVLVLAAAGCGVVDGDPDGDPVTPTATTARGTSGSPTTQRSSPAAPLPTGVPGAPRDVATDLAVPWSVVPLPSGEALVSLRDDGLVLRVGPDGSTTQVSAPGPGGAVPGVQHGGEGGLLGLALAPDDPDRLFVYATSSAGNQVTRWRLGGDTLTDPELVVGGIPRAGNHNGGRIAFGPDGFLYVATGDAGERPASQDPGSLAGKILRVTQDGEPAPGNPFPDSPVWSLGHRNVQGLGWTADGTMYASEFGQNRLDELNRIVPGGNYGWPHVEGSDGDGPYVDPVVTWSTGEASPSGLVVTGDAVYLAALRGQRLWRVPLAGEDVGQPQEYLTGQLGRLRDVVVSPSGDSLWLLTSNRSRGEPRPDDDRLVEVPLG